MARDDPTIYMRIPAELKQRLEEVAAENRRSITAEVVARLNYSFQSSIKPPLEPDEEDWTRVRMLNRQRDDLTARLTMLNSLHMQVDYEIRSAHADDNSGPPLDELRKQSGELRHDMWRVRRELEQVQHELDKAYAKVDGKQPTGEVKIRRAE